MAGFDEHIAREYFELHGFLVRQVRKYSVHSRRKLADEEIDLLIYNPLYEASGRKPQFLLFSSELPYIHRAFVVVKGWHTSRFTPAMLRSSSEIFSFLEKTVLKEAGKLFKFDSGSLPGADSALRILVLPGLPTAEPHRAESMRLLRERGIDGIISFRAMLLDLIQKVEINRNYQKSDLLQILRILKNYDLVKTSQLELFKTEGGGGLS